jgi:Arc/MetJ-type ribon-helix-helix transcriptional regulator
MTITLRPEHEKLIAEALRTGAYQNPQEVIGRALEMLQSEDEWLQDPKNSIEAKIERAFAQFERGEFLSPDESRAAMEKRKSDWLNDRHGSNALSDFD